MTDTFLEADITITSVSYLFAMSYSYVYKSKSEQWRQRQSVQELPQDLILGNARTAFIYLVLFGVGIYYFLRSSNILPPNAFRRFLWRLFVYSLPPSLVLALDKKDGARMDASDNRETYSNTRSFGAKSEAVWRILGLGSGAYMQKILMAKPTGSVSHNVKHTALPGLLNRDNECYQNSVIQGFAALPSFVDFVTKLPSRTFEEPNLRQALQHILERLNDPEQYGKAFWTPWHLKNMSSWQQQDAQEYFSKVIDELEKTVARLVHAEMRHSESIGLGCLRSAHGQQGKATRNQNASEIDLTSKSDGTKDGISKNRPAQIYDNNPNPLEGLLAQRVGCLRCGFVEGLTLIPFNCLTVSLDRVRSCDIESCLDQYTELETIPDVECPRCSLLRHERMYEKGLAACKENHDDPHVKEYLQITRTRLQSIKTALEEQDFSDVALTQKCKISAKTRVTTDKTKQAVIARSPKALVLHVNRSVFNESTGVQYKNFAAVRFPRLLDISRWSLGSTTNPSSDDVENWEINPSKSMVPELDEEAFSDSPNESMFSQQASSAATSGRLFVLRAVITHYGTHGDGHYITYRQSPQAVIEEDSRVWWRLSDDNVVEVDEDVVMNEGGVFMLFYERLQEDDQRPMTPASSLQSTTEPTIGCSNTEEVLSKEPSEHAELPHETTHDTTSSTDQSDIAGMRGASSAAQRVKSSESDSFSKEQTREGSEPVGLPRDHEPAISSTLFPSPSSHHVPESTQMKTAGDLRLEAVESQGLRASMLQAV